MKRKSVRYVERGMMFVRRYLGAVKRRILGLLPGKHVIMSPVLDPYDMNAYQLWLKNNEQQSEYKKLEYKPLISILIPVYNVKDKYLRECIESILKQKYDNFEIILVDDASTNKKTIDVLKEYENSPKIRVIYRKKNGHISRATNDALKNAKGEFIALMDNDDILPENALYEVVKVLNEDKKIDFIYTDEDKITEDGRRFDPNFKPDWSPDTFLSMNYISHLGVIRKSLMDEIGGFRTGYEGSQDYDLYLRIVEKTNKIYHLPKILYHWRAVEGSTAAGIENKNYALEKGKLALEDALKRRKIKGEVKLAKEEPYYYVEYGIEKEPKISIIIPTKDMASTTRKCLESIYEKTTYNNYEVVIVNNNSKEEETYQLFKEFEKKYNNFRVIDALFEFNYSKINNLAVRETDGEYIILLNNDTEVITPEWLTIMVGYASQKHIGAVGAQLFYPDNTVQHAGVVLGVGVASHVFLNVKRGTKIWGGRLSVPYNYSAVTAACLMVSRKKWNEVGGLEEELKVAYNDVDLNLKLLEKGYYNVCLPMVQLYHYESKSRGAENTPEKKRRFNQEQEFMYKKWSKRIKNDEFYNPNYSRLGCFVLDRAKNE